MTQKLNTLSPKGSIGPSTSSSTPTDSPTESAAVALEKWAEWCHEHNVKAEVQRVMYEAADMLREEHMAANRFAVELADLRIARGMALDEIERLHGLLREIYQTSGDDRVRALCENALLGSLGPDLAPGEPPR